MWTDLAKLRVLGFPNHFFCDSWAVGFWRTDLAHDHDGSGLDACFAGVCGLALAPRRQGPGRPEVSRSAALFCGSQHHLASVPEKFGHWNSVWKRFWRLSRAGTFEAFFDALAAMSETAHLVQMFDSTVVRAHVSAAGAKGGKTIRRSAARAAASRRKSTSRSISAACRSPFI